MDDAVTEFDHLIGTTIDGRYEIEALLGEGGFGGVFRAMHTGLRRPVAVKVLRAGGDPRGEATKRFEREAYSASRLDHPNCARVHDFGTLESGDKYLVMELVEGKELGDLVAAPWPPSAAVELGIQVLGGLAHAHTHGIVHRDLKPANVLVHHDAQGRPVAKLVDFGIAKILDDEVFDEKLTQTGLVFGTPRYMSPEQASGGKITERTDIYAAGLLLYHVLAGRPPFEAPEAHELLRMQIIVPPPPLPHSVPAELAQVVLRMLQKSSKDRWPTAGAVVEELQRLQPMVQGLAAAAPLVSGADATAAVTVSPLMSTGPSVPLPAVAPTGVTMPSQAGMTVPALQPGATPGAPMPVYQPPVGAGRRGGRSMTMPWIIAAFCGGVAVAVALALLLRGGFGDSDAADSERDSTADSAGAAAPMWLLEGGDDSTEDEKKNKDKDDAEDEGANANADDAEEKREKDEAKAEKEREKTAKKAKKKGKKGKKGKGKK